MGLVDRDKLRTNYEHVVERIEGGQLEPVQRPYVSTRLIEDVSVESTFEQYDRPFTFYGDEAKWRGGHERGPSPMRYLLSGIAFCLQGWYAKGSAFTDVEIGSLEVDLRTYLDVRGEHGFDDIPKHPQWLIVEVRVESTSPADRVLEMIDWGDERCPLGVLIRRAIPVHQRVLLNGTSIRDSVPEGLE
jgi:uncharacterized OsmC-like protein